MLSCVKVISETLGTLPLKTYIKKNKTRNEEDFSSVSRLFSTNPTPYHTPNEYVERIVTELLLYGDHVAIINGVENLKIDYLNPVDPENFIKTKLSLDSGGRPRVSYVIRDEATRELKEYDSSRIFHVKGLQTKKDKTRGASVISQSVDTFGIALSADNYAASTFKNQGIPIGILEYPEGLEEDEIDNIKRSWNAAYGQSNAGSVSILENGLKFSKLGLTPQDTQLLDTRKYSASQICGLFRCPPHKVGILENATFSNIEWQGIEFGTDCIRPWAVKIENALRKLFAFEFGNETIAKKYYAKFALDALFRGDLLARSNAYAVGRQWGWYSADDVREKEDMNPLPDGQGELYLVPMNMIPADKAATLQPKPTEKAPKDDESKRSIGAEQRKTLFMETQLNFSNLFTQALGRINRAEATGVQRAILSAKSGESLDKMTKYYEAEFSPFAKMILEPLVTAYSNQLSQINDGKLTSRASGVQIAVDTLDWFIAEYVQESKRELGPAVTNKRDSVKNILESWGGGRVAQETIRIMQRAEKLILEREN